MSNRTVPIFAAKRIIEVAVLFFIFLTLLFIIFRVMPQDPAALVYSPRMTPEVQAEQRELWGTDKPLREQYIIYIGNVFQGDLGISFYYSVDVSTLLEARLLPAVILMSAAVILGILIDQIAERNLGDSGSIGVLLCMIPFLWIGLIFMYFFSYHLGLFPYGGWKSHELWEMEASLGVRILDIIHHLVLPLIVMTIWAFLGILVIKTNIRGMIQEKKILIPPILATASVSALIFYGAKIAEVVFSWPGFQRTFIEAALNYDYPLEQGAAIAAVAFSLVTVLCVEIFYVITESQTKTSLS